EHLADRPEPEAARRAGLADRSPCSRIAAARFLHAGSEGTLRSLLEDRRTPDHVSADAASLLAARLPPEEAGPLLIATLKGRSGETRRQAIQELGRLKHAASVGPLCVLLENADPRTAAAAAAALEAIGDPRTQARLLDAVRQDAAELRIAAARALGALGTVKVVETLLEELDAKRMDEESRQAIRQAVSAIQSRLAGAEAGQLSLAASSAAAGRLSLAPPRAGPGDVSLASDPDR